MEWNLLFFINSVLLGVGLAMDAFSVSLANGLNEPQMGTRRMCGIAGVFAFFQALMPMTGWVCIHTIVSHFQAFEKLIQNKTVVMIAHRLSTIRNADQILVMEKGCLIESGTHDELLKKDGKYAQMWSSYTESINWKIGTGKAV